MSDSAAVHGGDAKVAVVVGGGLVGVCQARALAKRGWDVTLLERNSELCLEASRANAGRFAASAMWRGPIAKPNWAVVKAAFGAAGGKEKTSNAEETKKEKSSGSTTKLTGSLVKWGAHFLRNCLPGRYEHNRSMFAFLVEKCLAEHELLYNEIDGLAGASMRNERGVYVFDERTRRKTTEGFEKELSCDECKRLVPALLSHQTMTGCYFLTRDYTADARQFALRVASDAQDRFGVKLKFNSTVDRIFFDPSDATKATGVRVVSNEGMQSQIKADAVVLCPGPCAASLSRSLLGYWLPLPVEPMRGCSVLLTGVSGTIPNIAVHDLTSGWDFQVTPLKTAPDYRGRQTTSVRLIGFGEWAGDECTGGSCASPPPKDHVGMFRSHLAKTIPGLKYEKMTNLWYGGRPMTPDSLPILGLAPGYSNIYLNCGHGHIGWSMCSGTASIVADIMGSTCDEETKVYQPHFSAKRFGLFAELFGRNSAVSYNRSSK